MGSNRQNEKSVADRLELENLMKVEVFPGDEKNSKGKQIRIVNLWKGFAWRTG
jgi:hypothetical protein